MQLKLHPSEKRTTCLFNMKQEGEKQSYSKTRSEHKTLTSTFLTGAHLSHKFQEVRKASSPYVEYAGEHNWQTTERWVLLCEGLHVRQTSVRAQASVEASCTPLLPPGLSLGAAVTWTALTGRVVRCGESQWHFPRKPPSGGEPTMRKGSYFEKLVKSVACIVVNSRS